VLAPWLDRARGAAPATVTTNRQPYSCPYRARGTFPPKGKGPGQHLRTGVRPVGNGLGLRCLLVARALSTPNPPSSRMSVPDPFGPIGLRLVSRAAGCERLLPWRNPKPDESAGPADEPGAGPEQQLTLDRGNVNRVRSTHGEGSITFSNRYGECRCTFSHVAYGPSRPPKSSVGFVWPRPDFLSLLRKYAGGSLLQGELSGYGFPHLASSTSRALPRLTPLAPLEVIDG